MDGQALLQVQDAVSDFLRPALIPELCTDVAASPACHVYLVLIAVSAFWAFPDEFALVLHVFDLSIEAAHLAVIALGVELGVHDMVVDELNHGDYRWYVVLHIGDLYVTYGSTGRKGLEFRLELQLCESVDRFPDVHMVGVGDVIVIAYVFDDAEVPAQSLPVMTVPFWSMSSRLHRQQLWLCCAK